MDWMYIAMCVCFGLLLLVISYIAIDFLIIRRRMKKKEKLRKEANQKDFMDEEADKVKSDEVSKE